MNRDKLYSVPELKGRGWTDTAIKKFLPAAPDDTRPNPYYRGAGWPMKFWLKARVQRIERTKRFVEWQDGVSARKMGAQRAVITRAENMAQRMRSVEITIKRGVSETELHQLALTTHGGNYRGDPGPFCWSNQTARNCIRHNLTNYEQLWNLCNRGDTGQEAYEILRERVDELIDEAYPQYADSE